MSKSDKEHSGTMWAQLCRALRADGYSGKEFRKSSGVVHYSNRGANEWGWVGRLPKLYEKYGITEDEPIV